MAYWVHNLIMRSSVDCVDDAVTLAMHRPPHLFFEFPLLYEKLCLELVQILVYRRLDVSLEIDLESFEFVHDALGTSCATG